jgi:molybdopterin converting factor small subunit
MTITLKLFSILEKHLPPGAVRNQAQIEIRDGASVGDVLADHGVALPLCQIILVNGVYSRPADVDGVILNENDVLAVWPPVAGG